VSVRLVEKGAEVGRPIRTSGGSWLADLDALGIPRRLAHPLVRVRLVAPGREARWSYPEPRICVLDVTAVYQFLARQAVSAGASICVGHTALTACMDNGRVVGVQVRGAEGSVGAVRTVVTVDASGFGALLARKAGLYPGFQRFGVGVEYDLHAPQFHQREAVLFVGRQLADRGYGWAFPHVDERVRLGIGVLRPDSELHPRALLERLRRHPVLALGLEGARVLEVHSGVLPAEPARGRLSTNGLLLAGDSGVQASPLVGEGIRYAVLAGRLAGSVAAGAVIAGDVSAARLAAYDRAWHRRFGREMALAWWINQRASRYGDRNWRIVAALMSQLSADQAAAALHGDVDVRWCLGLARKTPRLAAAAVASLRAERGRR
jgi:digeranylgeranylglycerophospholipid reductase